MFLKNSGRQQSESRMGVGETKKIFRNLESDFGRRDASGQKKKKRGQIKIFPHDDKFKND